MTKRDYVDKAKDLVDWPFAPIYGGIDAATAYALIDIALSLRKLVEVFVGNGQNLDGLVAFLNHLEEVRKNG